MARIATCEYCGKNGPSEQRFGITYCKDCYDAIIKKNTAYFDNKDSSKATEKAKKDVEDALLTEEEKARRLKKAEELQEQKRLEFEVIKQKLPSRCTTTNSFEDANIEEYLGTVSGLGFYLEGGIIGEGTMMASSLFSKAFKKAKEDMFRDATDLGANAIVGMQTAFTSAGKGDMFVAVTGTAVRIKVKEKP